MVCFSNAINCIVGVAQMMILVFKVFFLLILVKKTRCVLSDAPPSLRRCAV